MTTDKAHKRAVRARMTKTGESYTSARRHVNPPPTDLVPLPPRIAEPDTSEAAVLAGTGRTWDEWFRILDAADGTAMRHTDIARWLVAEHPITGWWAQNVTVGYERARGLRAVNQRPDGFSVNASRTFPVSVERLFDVLTEQAEADMVRLRSARRPRSARFDVLENTTRVSATLTARAPDKASVQLQQMGLADTDTLDYSSYASAIDIAVTAGDASGYSGTSDITLVGTAATPSSSPTA